MEKYKTISYLFTSPFFVDAFQQIQRQTLEIDWVYLLLAIIGASVGSSVRIAYETQKVKVKKKRVVFIFICSIVVAYLVYSATIDSNLVKYMGMIAIVGGVISVDIIRIFIEVLPEILGDALRKYIMNKANEKNNNDNDAID